MRLGLGKSSRRNAQVETKAETSVVKQCDARIANNRYRGSRCRVVSCRTLEGEGEGEGEC